MTQYYVVTDTNNLPIAFYNDAIYPANADGSLNASIPKTAITITEAQWTDLVSNQGARQIVNGAIQAYTYVPTETETKSAMTKQVDAERDRRMFGGLMWQNVIYQTDSEAITNILGACQLASLAIAQGAQAGNLRWSNPSSDFYWIAADNSHQKMDAQTVVALAVAVGSFRTTVVYAARTIKDAVQAGTASNITADSTWGFGPYGQALS